MRNFTFLAFAALLLAAPAFAQDLEDDPPARRSSASSSSSASGPWRAGFGLQAGRAPLGGAFVLAPGLALISEYCFTGEICASASASVLAGTGSFNAGGFVLQQNGFDADLSAGARFILTPGDTELSMFGLVQAGLANPGGVVVTELGLFAGVALEQKVWDKIYVRLSTSLVGAQTVFAGNAFAGILQVTFNPGAFLVAHF